MNKTNADVAKHVAKPLTPNQKAMVLCLMFGLLIFMFTAVLWTMAGGV